LYDVLFLLMAAGQDSQHDFAPAWLKLPSQDALVCYEYFTVRTF